MPSLHKTSVLMSFWSNSAIWDCECQHLLVLSSDFMPDRGRYCCRCQEQTLHRPIPCPGVITVEWVKRTENRESIWTFEEWLDLDKAGRVVMKAFPNIVDCRGSLLWWSDVMCLYFVPPFKSLWPGPAALCALFQLEFSFQAHNTHIK